VTDLWLPGVAPAPQSLADFVKRVHGRIERYTAGHAEEKTEVEVELADGERLLLQSLSAEPGYGFVTLATHPEDDGDDPRELIVPVMSIRKITLRPEPAERAQFGFSLPSDRGAELEETEPAA
jgi:hypothetical protein